MQEVIEKPVKFFPKIITNENNVVAQVNLVPPELIGDRLI